MKAVQTELKTELKWANLTSHTPFEHRYLNSCPNNNFVEFLRDKPPFDPNHDSRFSAYTLDKENEQIRSLSLIFINGTGKTLDTSKSAPQPPNHNPLTNV